MARITPRAQSSTSILCVKMFTCSGPERRRFYRIFSWFLMGTWIVHMVYEAFKKEVKKHLCHDSQLSTKSFIYWALENGVYYNLLLVFAAAYLDYYLWKAEKYLFSFVKKFINETRDWTVEYNHSLNTEWLIIMFFVEFITPFFCFMQYMNAFCLYYGESPISVNMSSDSHPILSVFWVVTTFSCFDAFTKAGFLFVACIFYRSMWFSRLFGPDANVEDLQWLTSEVVGFPDWVFFVHLCDAL